MHSLLKNENISRRGKRIAQQQKKLLPFLPGLLLNVLEEKIFLCEIIIIIIIIKHVKTFSSGVGGSVYRKVEYF